MHTFSFAVVSAMLLTASASAESAPDLSNRALAAVELANEIRMDGGLPPLKAVPELMQAARAHAEDMAAQGYFSHQARDGSSPSDRAKRAGYAASASENIAWSSADSTAFETVTRWMRSSGHRANILGAHREIGVGFARRASECYAVMVLGTRTDQFPVILEGERRRTSSPSVRAYVHGNHYIVAMRVRVDDGPWGPWMAFRNEWTARFAGPGARVLRVELRDLSGRTAVFGDEIEVDAPT